MGKRRRVKGNSNMKMNKNENGNGETRTSTSCPYWTRSQKGAADPEIRELELTRRQKRKKDIDGSPNSPDQVLAAEDQVREGPINDLPPEMLMKILKFINTLQLFDCRLVSHEWMEMANQILIGRTDSFVHFYKCLSGLRRISPRRGPLETKWRNKLQKFSKCMKTSKNNIPYSRFYFSFEDPLFLDGENWLGFLSAFSVAPSNSNPTSNPNPTRNQRTKIKCLQFSHSIKDKKTLLIFTEKLRDLLLRKIPRLEEFGLVLFPPDDFTLFTDSNDIKLFPLGNITESEPTTKTAALSAAVPVPIPVPVQLAYLKVLEICRSMFVNFPGLVGDLLGAAVNLTRLQVERPFFPERDCTSQIFRYLHSLGKLHLLKTLEIQVTQEFLSDEEQIRSTTAQHQHLDFSMAFKIQELKLYAFVSEINPTFYADAENFMSNVLESSKDTLETLEMPPLGFLQGLHFPKFSKLWSLELDTWDEEMNPTERRQQFFPPQMMSNSRELFATVRKIEITTTDWTSAFPQEDSIPIFPLVQNFCLKDYELTKENVVAKLGFMCPNLKRCKIKVKEGIPRQFNFPQVGREIWTHLRQLESLEVDVDADLENHAFPALDSCFTGISIGNCRRLEELRQAQKTRGKNSKARLKLADLEEVKRLTENREHHSILDMKNLKTLLINLQSGMRQNDGKNFFTTKITWISKEFAFKLMPHLQVKIHRKLVNCESCFGLKEDISLFHI